MYVCHISNYCHLKTLSNFRIMPVAYRFYLQYERNITYIRSTIIPNLGLR